METIFPIAVLFIQVDSTSEAFIVRVLSRKTLPSYGITPSLTASRLSAPLQWCTCSNTIDDRCLGALREIILMKHHLNLHVHVKYLSAGWYSWENFLGRGGRRRTLWNETNVYWTDDCRTQRQRNRYYLHVLSATRGDKRISFSI